MRGRCSPAVVCQCYSSREAAGHPCIRGMRVTVSNVLRLLAAHHDKRRILEAYSYLEEEDIDACLEYAAMLANESEIEAVA